MKVSHGARLADFSTKNGYGYVTDRMIDSLKKLGHEVSSNDPDAKVNLWYDQPHHIEWGENQYRIAYHPWESTRLKPGWPKILNTADEVWTPSPIVAKWYRRAGIRKPIYVYEHGVDPIWSRKLRRVDDKIRFLHVGGEAARKGGEIAIEAFRAAFPNRDDVELTMKMITGNVLALPTGRIRFITKPLSLEDLVALYHDHHVFVYPSWGEGFGLNPLQAMRTGMPAIFTGAWAPYAWLTPQKWLVDSTLTESPWQFMHPGRMFKPNLDDLVDKMRFMADNYDVEAIVGQSTAAIVERHYDWLNLTREAFDCLDNRLKNL